MTASGSKRWGGRPRSSSPPSFATAPRCSVRRAACPTSHPSSSTTRSAPCPRPKSTPAPPRPPNARSRYGSGDRRHHQDCPSLCYSASNTKQSRRRRSAMAQRHAFGGNEILRQQIGLFAPRQRARVRDIAEKAPGEPDEMGVMPEAEGIGHNDPPFAVPPVEADPGKRRLRMRDTTVKRRRDIRLGHDIELRPVILGSALAQFEPGAAAAIGGGMRVVALLGLPLPACFQIDVNTANLVTEPPVAEIFERIVPEPRREMIGP